MKWWALIKQFPKYALVAGVIIGSTTLFALWWFLRPHAKPQSGTSNAQAEIDRAAIQKKAAQAEARVDYLFLADDDLYDAGTGELVFKNWLHGDHPIHLYYDAQSKRLFGEYREGFVRYSFDGTRVATMMRHDPPAVVPGSKKIVFVKGKDIWTAEIDWTAFKFINERQATTMGVFAEQNFEENVQLLTEKTLVVRNLNNLLHVDLGTGNVKPMRLPLGEIGKRRSPDSKWVVGVLDGQFYCYDVDANEAKTMPVGRNGFSDFQWLGNDRCLGLSEKTVVAYDRTANSLSEVITLPFPCFKMGEPSPDGRYIFCAGGMNARNGVLVDLEKKTAAQVNGGAGVCWVSPDTFIYSRDVPDSDLRGTWLQTVGQRERQISPEPYGPLTSGNPLVLLRHAFNAIICATPIGLFIHASDSSTKVTSLQSQVALKPNRLQRISMTNNL